MLVKVKIPSVLRVLTDGNSTIEVEFPSDAVVTIGDVFAWLAKTHVGVHDRTLDEHGQIRQHINVFINSDSVRDLAGLESKVAPGDVISIIPAVSGGRFANSTPDGSRMPPSRKGV